MRTDHRSSAAYRPPLAQWQAHPRELTHQRSSPPRVGQLAGAGLDLRIVRLLHVLPLHARLGHLCAAGRSEHNAQEHNTDQSRVRQPPQSAVSHALMSPLRSTAGRRCAAWVPVQLQAPRRATRPLQRLQRQASRAAAAVAAVAAVAERQQQHQGSRSSGSRAAVERQQQQQQRRQQQHAPEASSPSPCR